MVGDDPTIPIPTRWAKRVASVTEHKPAGAWYAPGEEWLPRAGHLFGDELPRHGRPILFVYRASTGETGFDADTSAASATGAFLSHSWILERDQQIFRHGVQLGRGTMPLIRREMMKCALVVHHPDAFLASEFDNLAAFATRFRVCEFKQQRRLSAARPEPPEILRVGFSTGKPTARLIELSTKHCACASLWMYSEFGMHFLALDGLAAALTFFQYFFRANNVSLIEVASPKELPVW